MHSRLTLPLVLALVALTAGCVADRGGTFVDGPQVVMRIERDGPLVNEDVTLAERLSGHLVVEDRTARGHVLRERSGLGRRRHTGHDCHGVDVAEAGEGR